MSKLIRTLIAYTSPLVFFSLIQCHLASAEGAKRDYIGELDPPNMIEVGTGVSAGEGAPLEALFSVDIRLGESGPWTREMILVKITGDATRTTTDTPYIDFQFEALTAQGRSDSAEMAISMIGLDLQRNLQLGNNLAVRIQFAGMRGASEISLGKNTSAYVRGAIDLLGLSVTQGLATAGTSKIGLGLGFSAEAGIRLFDRVRITFQEKLGHSATDPIRTQTGYICDSYWDDWGNSSSSCYNTYQYQSGGSSTVSNTLLSMVVDLTDHLSVVGKTVYSIYAFDKELVPTSYGNLRYFVGVNGRF